MVKTFKMSNIEEETYKEWLKEHDKVCKYKKKGKTRYISFCFTPVGIGTAILVKCSCGKSIDITDVSTW